MVSTLIFPMWCHHLPWWLSWPWQTNGTLHHTGRYDPNPRDSGVTSTQRGHSRLGVMGSTVVPTAFVLFCKRRLQPRLNATQKRCKFRPSCAVKSPPASTGLSQCVHQGPPFTGPVPSAKNQRPRPQRRREFAVGAGYHQTGCEKVGLSGWHHPLPVTCLSHIHTLPKGQLPQVVPGGAHRPYWAAHSVSAGHGR